MSQSTLHKQNIILKKKMLTDDVCISIRHANALNVFPFIVPECFYNDKFPARSGDSTLPGVCLSLPSACPLYHHLAAGLTISADYSHNKIPKHRFKGQPVQCGQAKAIGNT